jgi:hypothetical protein
MIKSNFWDTIEICFCDAALYQAGNDGDNESQQFTGWNRKAKGTQRTTYKQKSYYPKNN